MCADSLARCFATSVQNSSTKKPCVDNCHYLVTLRLGGKCTRPPRVLGRKQCTATASYECKQSSESTLVGGTSHALSVGDLVDLISRKVRWRSDESTPETVCRSVQRPFLHSSSVCPTHRHYRHRGTHVAHLAASMQCVQAMPPRNSHILVQTVCGLTRLQVPYCRQNISRCYVQCHVPLCN